MATNYGLPFFAIPYGVEELTRFEPSRLALQQTLGGAWADCFDRGVVAIKVSGHTGWHGGGPESAIPGEAQFALLRESAFEGWHRERDRLIQGGADPAGAEMYFVDTLNGFTDLVAPKSFTLRRSKSRPLLMMYSMELLVLQPVASATNLAGAAVDAVAALGGAVVEAFNTVSLFNDLGLG